MNIVVTGEAAFIGRWVVRRHPQCEIKKLFCDASYAEKLLGWSAKVSLDSGISKTEAFLKKQM